MRILILEVNSDELIRGLIKEGEKTKMPSLMEIHPDQSRKLIEEYLVDKVE